MANNISICPKIICTFISYTPVISNHVQIITISLLFVKAIFPGDFYFFPGENVPVRVRPETSAVKGATVTRPKLPTTVSSISAATYL